MGTIFKSYDEMVAGVSKESGVSEADVRKVLTASFASTRAYIVEELQKGAGDVSGQERDGDQADHVPA